ncbi:AraC family transcriptional regulator [Pedobacter montanisoli]|uniref:AraC family transcriptional regulator n=1 Tax=Pedobacter montanisoli TaxID=2923277 RepID=A0ABT0A004_9SPHI|nr:AraC family transcriptional regulator [Pedobacter montanisoli]MCJ0743854.1 AraC family transcriptional regulator [Pedobacter montanisoli]
MKVLQFAVPVAATQTIMVQEDLMPHFYPHLHKHEEAQLIWIKKGTGTLLINNDMHLFKGGDVFFIGANQPHLFKSDSAYFKEDTSLKIEALSVFFDPEGKISGVFNLPEMQMVKQLLSEKAAFKVSEKHQDNIAGQILGIKNAEPRYAVVKFLELLLGLLAISAELESLTVIQHYAADADALRINSVLHFLMKNYERQLSLSEVAAYASMTPQAFCRYFKKHTRQTFTTYVNNLRINEVCSKLIRGEYPNISTAVYESGFANVTSFNRVFKQIKGKNPKSYLKQYYANVSL